MPLFVRHAVLDGNDVDLVCDGGTIAAIGRSVEPPVDARVIEARGMAVEPGLVNAHTHAAMTLLRGYGSDVQLHEWLHDWIFPVEAGLTEEDVYWGTRLAIVEMLRSGTVHFFDMYPHSAATARAVVDGGIRATIGEAIFGGDDPEGLERVLGDAEEATETLRRCGDRVKAALAPHSISLTGEPALAWIARYSGEHQLPVHLHFCETVREVEEWSASRRERPVDYLARLGLLHERTLLAHACVLDADDFTSIAAAGATVVTNPVSNAKLAGPPFPYPAARAAGVRIGIGTDGAASNNSLDLLSDLKTFSLIQKQLASDPAVLPAAEALAIARGQRSPLLGGGPIEVGGPADFVLIDTTLPEMVPGGITDNLVYGASGSVVDTVVVDGVAVMQGRRVEGQDDIVGAVRDRAARLRQTA